jgi:divalent metal cation (Fe/Co/Zn/Cd) transporter
MRVVDTAPAPAVDRETYGRLAGRARLLSWASLAYMALEGGVAILAGLVAGSVALVGFGLDSVIEGVASVIIVWRFAGSRMFSEVAEHRTQKLVAVQFFILAPYVAVESVRALVQGERPGVSWLGVALSASSLVVMPYLGVAKQRIADRIGSAANPGRGSPEPALRRPRGRPPARPARQRARRRLVAGPARRPPHRRRRRP